MNKSNQRNSSGRSNGSHLPVDRCHVNPDRTSVQPRVDHQREWIERRRPAERMRPLRPALAPEEPLSRCPALWQATGRADFPVLFEDRVVGLMPRERWQRALRRLGPEAPVGEAMERRFYAVPADEECTEQVAALLAAHQIPIPVVRDGQAVGVLIPDEREDAARPVAATGRWTLDLGPA